MAETKNQSSESKSIKELTAAVVASNTKRQEQLERIAETTDHEGTTRAKDAKALLKKEEESLATQKRLLGVSDKRFEKATVISGAIVEQKKIIEAQKTELEKLGVDASSNKEFRKEELKLAKMELAQAKASGSKEAEADAKKKMGDLKSQSFLGSMAKGMLAMGKGAIKTGASKLPSLKSLLMTGGLAALLFFLKSPYFVKVKDFIEKEVLPVLANLYDNILKPMGRIFTDFFVGTWENIKTLFSDLGESFDLFEKGEWWAGITKFFGGIAGFLLKQIDKVTTLVWNLIASVFGLEETDSVWGSIKGFFTDLYNDVVDWIAITWDSISKKISGVFTDVKNFFLKIFSWSSEEDEKDSIVVKYIKKAVEGVKTWLGKMFKFDSASDIITSVFNYVTFLPNIIKDALLGVTSWLLGLFGFDDAAKKVTKFNDWTIGSVITKALSGIVDWLSNLFDFDIAGWIKEKAGMLGEVGSWLLEKVGVGGKKTTTSTSKTDAEAIAKREEQQAQVKAFKKKAAETKRRKDAEKLEVLKGKAGDLESQIQAGDLKSAWFTTTESDLRDAREELAEMKAQIEALNAKANVTAVDAKTVTNAPKTTNVTHMQTNLRNQTSAAWAAAGSAW